MDYAFTNLDDSALFWRTLYTDEPWTIAPAYSGLKGYDSRMVMPDILHVWHLGVGRDLAGSAIVFMIKETDIFQGANQQERLHSATMSLKQFARSQKLPLKLHKLSKAKLGWTGKTFPELKSSGYDTYVTLKWLLQLSHVFSDALPNSLCSCLWTADHVISLLTNGGRYLSEEEQENKEVFGMVFLREYMALANLALRQRKRLYRLRPKFHILHHMVKFKPQSLLNPAAFSTWVDEDCNKRLMRVLRQTDPRTSCKRLLQRYLLRVPGTFLKKHKAEK